MNVYDNGQPDERQTDESALAPQHSLFRKRYRQLSAEDVALHDAIKDKADELAVLIAEVALRRPEAPRTAGRQSILANVGENQGANVTLALRHLEDAVYRSIKALTA